MSGTVGASQQGTHDWHNAASRNAVPTDQGGSPALSPAPRRPVNGPNAPPRRVPAEHHQLGVLAVDCAPLEGAGAAARRRHPRHISAENDAGRFAGRRNRTHKGNVGGEMMGAVFGPGFEVSTLQDHRVGCQQCQSRSAVARRKCLVEGSDCRDGGISRRLRCALPWQKQAKNEKRGSE